MTTTWLKIEEAQAELEAQQSAFLTKWGWRHTSNTPGSFWMWVRDFSDVDAKRKAWDDEANAKNPDRRHPHKSEPFGIVTADAETAIRMTLRCPWLNVVETETPEMLVETGE